MKTRYSARLLILSQTNELLLFRYEDEHREPFWATPGGELRNGESFRDAAERELREETGFIISVGEAVRSREAVYAVARSTRARWIERYFIVKTKSQAAPDRSCWTVEEQSTIRSWHWWSATQIRSSEETFLPEWLPEVLEAETS